MILSSRYLLKRVQQKYLSRDTLLEGLHNRSDLVAGQILRVYQGEKIPADGVLTSTQAEVDMSLFNGESLPEIFHQGMALNAGSVLLSKDAEMRVEKVGLETRLGQLLLQLQADSVQKSRLISLTDRLSQILIVTVMLLALAFFLFYSQYDLNQALERALALIVIACPCALAFGSPLAYGLGLRKAQKQGILIRNPDVFERLKDIQNIFFDKTGTLTEGQLKLVSIDGEIRPEERAIILALELHSLHPVAFALRREWSATASLPAVESSHEITGDGVYGKINGTEYSLTRSKELNILDFLAVEFRVDGRLKAHLFFEDPLRMESPSILKSLSNYQLHILSGDKKNRVLKTAALCEIPEANCYAELTPEQKKSFVLLSPGSCMIGDGVNDALALKAAEVGIAVKGSVDLSLMSADVYFTRGGLRPFYDLLKIATQARRTLRRNLAISLIYNILGGILALGGFVNPMVAAILMPISSVLIVISSLRGVQ